MAISQGTVLDNVSLAWSTVNPSNGDLFILFFYNDGGDDQGTGPADLTRIGTGDQGTSMEAGCYKRTCTGSETGNVFTSEADFNSMGNEGYNAHWFLIPAAEWHGTTIPEIADVQAATGTIDPPSLSPSGWDASAEDTIWIICGGRDDDDGLSAVSSGYSTNEQLTESTNQVEVGSSYRIAATATENPGTYTQTGTAEEFIAFTVAVRPPVAGDVEVIVPLGTLALTGLVPTIQTPRDVQVPLGTLALTGLVPTVTIDNIVDVPLGTLVVTGHVPTIQTPRNVDVPLGTLVLTGYAPDIGIGVNVQVPLGTLAVTGYAPTVTVTENVNVAVPLGTLTLTGLVPTVVASDHQEVDVPLGTLALTGYAPTVTVAGDVEVIVPLATLALTGYAPTVVGVGDELLGLDKPERKPREYERQLLDLPPAEKRADPILQLRRDQRTNLEANQQAEALARQNEQAAAERLAQMIASDKAKQDQADRARAARMANLAKAQVAKEQKQARQDEINRVRKKNLQKARRKLKRQRKKK